MIKCIFRFQKIKNYIVAKFKNSKRFLNDMGEQNTPATGKPLDVLCQSIQSIEGDVSSLLEGQPVDNPQDRLAKTINFAIIWIDSYIQDGDPLRRYDHIKAAKHYLQSASFTIQQAYVFAEEGNFDRQRMGQALEVLRQAREYAKRFLDEPEL